MNMLQRYLAKAGEDECVFLTDVRESFLQEGTRPFHLQCELYDGGKRLFKLLLPVTQTEEEKNFAASFVYANVYNIISSLGGVKITVYLDPDDADALALARSLNDVFQSDMPKVQRYGYGKCMNVNDRVLSFLTGGKKQFSFAIEDEKEMPPADMAEETTAGTAVFSQLPAVAASKCALGMDIGGTDIKLVSSVNGSIAVCKEYDWYPAGFAAAQELIDPVMNLVRLMRAATSLVSAGKKELIDEAALSKDADEQTIQQGIEKMEAALDDKTENFDAIGLSFPDVVIDHRIVGGETFKTKGMRDNRSLDYEEQFRKISGLNELLRSYVKNDGVVMNTNDGPMAAFTAAVELAAVGEDVSHGFFAHTLGTELGTGWVKSDGTIPGIPLEVYNFIIDLGSFAQKAYPSSDVRSINNFNTSLPGTLQKYTCQYGVFRLAAKYLPKEDPQLYQHLFDEGLFAEEGEAVIVPVAPKDMRKSALEFFMKKAAEGHSVCSRIFREIGTYLAVTWQETEYFLHPEAKERSLFGRLVKVPACFALMNEGARERVPSLNQYAADSSLANTDLMKQLDAHPDYTVAQFAQAVGAIYFGCLGLL